MPAKTLGGLHKRQLRKTYLREWRKHRGYTLETAGEMIGIKHTTLSRVERRVMPYSQALLEAAAEAYRCSPADLIMRDPSDREGIWTVWDHAKPGERRQIVDVAKVIVGGGRTGTDG